MAQTNPQVPIDHDPLGETLHQLRLHGTLYCRADLTAPWGIDLPAMEGCMMFHIVTAGQCLLEVDGAEPRLLREGSLALVPHGLGHVLRSTTGDVKTPLFDIPVDKISERYEVMRHGGGGEPMQLTCGVLRFDHVAAHRLLALLPRVVEADSWSAADGGWLRSTIGLITHEAQSPRPGGETIITRLADVIVVQAIRSWLNSAPEAEQGWLAALRDPQIGCAGRLANPARPRARS